MNPIPKLPDSQRMEQVQVLKQKLLMENSKIEQVRNGLYENGVIDKGTPISARVYSRKRGRETTPEAQAKRKKPVTTEQKIDGLIGRTADSLLVLAGLRQLNGGGTASSLELQLAGDVQRNLETLVSRVAPSSIFDKKSLENMLDTLNFKLTADNRIEAVQVEKPKANVDEADSDNESNDNIVNRSFQAEPSVVNLLSPGVLSFEDEADADLRQADEYDEFQDEHMMYIRHKQLVKLVQQIKSDVPLPVGAISNSYMNTVLPCAVCQVMVREMTGVLVCDCCERIHHHKCLSTVKLLPKNDWYCQRCVIENGGKSQPHKYGSVKKADKPAVQNVKGQVKPAESSQQSGNSFSPSFEQGKQEHKAATGEDDSKSASGPSDSTKDEAGNTVSGFSQAAMESRVVTPRVDWIGEPHLLKGRAFYKSFSVAGITFRIKDCAMFNPEGDAPPYIARILSAWQDLETNKNYVRVNWCYYPNDNQLPAVETLPETSEIDEVYESNHSDDNIAESIQGPCMVLTPQKYIEEKKKRASLMASSNFMDDLPPLFICKWYFDTAKAHFRKVGEDNSSQ